MRQLLLILPSLPLFACGQPMSMLLQQRHCAVSAITGTLSVTTGSTITLGDATTGGTWTSSNTAVATAGGSTGIVSGVSAGTTAITYTMPHGCYATAVVTVSAAAPTYATWSTTDKTSGITLSNGNLTETGGGAGPASDGVRSTVAMTGSDIYYYEITLTTQCDNGNLMGFADASAPINGLTSTATGNSWGWLGQYATIQYNGNFSAYSMVAFLPQGHIVSMLVNMGTHTAAMYFDGTNAMSAPPITGIPSTLYASDGVLSGFCGDTHTANFGQSPFSYLTAVEALCGCTPTKLGIY